MTTEKTTCPTCSAMTRAHERLLETVDEKLDALGELCLNHAVAPEKRLAALELWLSYAFPGEVAHVIPPGRIVSDEEHEAAMKTIGGDE